MTRTSEDDFLSIDGLEYRDIAANLAAGHGFATSSFRWYEPHGEATAGPFPDLHRPPLLPLIGAVLCFLPGNWIGWAKGAATLIGVAMVAAIWLLGTSLLGRKAGWIAAGVFAVYPYAIHYSARWSTENLYALCLLLGLFFLCRLRKSDRATTLTTKEISLERETAGTTNHAAASGLFFGLASLARPNGLLLALGFWIYLTRRAKKGIRLRAAGAFLVTTLAVLTPWAARNYLVTGFPTPATSFAPLNAWLGMNDRIYSMYREGERPSFANELDSLYQEDLKTHISEMERRAILDQQAVNRYWLDRVGEYVAGHPGRAAFIVGSRILHFFRLWPNRATVPRSVFWASLLSVTPLMLLGLGALFTHREARDPLLLLPAALGLLGSLPFIFHLRFRYPIFDPYLVILASLMLSDLAGRVFSRGKIRTPRSA